MAPHGFGKFSGVSRLLALEGKSLRRLRKRAAECGGEDDWSG